MPNIKNGFFFCDCGCKLCRVGERPKDVIVYCKKCKREIAINKGRQPAKGKIKSDKT